MCLQQVSGQQNKLKLKGEISCGVLKDETKTFNCGTEKQAPKIY